MSEKKDITGRVFEPGQFVITTQKYTRSKALELGYVVGETPKMVKYIPLSYLENYDTWGYENGIDLASNRSPNHLVIVKAPREWIITVSKAAKALGLPKVAKVS
jgi:hypothetical protein